MPVSAWITLIIVGGALFGGLAWSVYIAVTGSNKENQPHNVI